MEMGDIIKKLRRDRGLTQTELAEKTGVSQSAIKMIETKRNKPSFELLNRIAEVFEVEPSQLLELNPNIEREIKVNSFTMDLLKKLVKEGVIEDTNNISEEEMNLIISAIKFDLKRIMNENKKDI